jgi:DNA-binding NarL/FixJ family response regulator
VSIEHHRHAQELVAQAEALEAEGQGEAAMLLYSEAADLEDRAFWQVPSPRTKTRGILAASSVALLVHAHMDSKAAERAGRYLESAGLPAFAVTRLRAALESSRATEYQGPEHRRGGPDRRTMEQTKILLVDDQALFRMGMRGLLEREPDFVIVGEADDSQSAIELALETSPDIILMDVSLGTPNGIETTQRIKRELASAGIIVLAQIEDEDSLFDAIKAGAAAFILKDVGPDDLVPIIRRVSAGEYLINDKVFAKPAVASRVLKEFRELAVYGQEAALVFAPLSPREVEILDNIAQGMTNKQVAYALSISEQTVKNHMSSILRKLSVNDRTQAVVYAIRQGWIRMPED